MNASTTSDQESVDERRARFEQFRFVVLPNGVVNVCNESYGEDSSEHVYSVTSDGCSCEHYQYRDIDACKHMIAVEQNPLVSSASRAASTDPVAADGSGEVENVCFSCGSSYPKGESCDCGGIDDL